MSFQCVSGRKLALECYMYIWSFHRIIPSGVEQGIWSRAQFEHYVRPEAQWEQRTRTIRQDYVQDSETGLLPVVGGVYGTRTNSREWCV
jgi:hypothetical protein